MIETPNSGGGEIAVPELHRHLRRKGKPLSPDHRAKISAAHKGKHRTPETRAKISTALKRKPLSAETRAKMSAAKSGANHPLFGKHHTPKTRAKMSAAKMGRPKIQKTRAKMSAAAKEREAGKRIPINLPSPTSPSSAP